MIVRLSLLLAGALFFQSTLEAEDWPQFLGPTRNGVYAGKDLAKTWPKEGPAVVWRKSVGEGFSGPVVSAQKVILFSREKNDEIIEALDDRTGKPVWRAMYPTTYRDDFGFDPGPRATPCVADGRIYTLGADGLLQCLDLADGKKIWQVDTKNQFRAGKGFFGIACSPLVEGNAVLVNIGGRDGAGIVAFDKTTGKVLWKTSTEEASYSSPVSATFEGQRYALFLTRKSFVGIDPVKGEIRFEYAFGPTERNSVTAATPVVVGDLVFLSGCYGAGACVVRVQKGQVEKVWAEDDVLSNHYATCVEHDGFLYGIDGRTDPGLGSPSLRCVELKTGKLRWQDDSLGAATVTLAGDQLLILSEKGELVRAPAVPAGFKPVARAQILSVQVRAYPAIANGLFYARSKNQLVCVNLGEAPLPASKP